MKRYLVLVLASLLFAGCAHNQSAPKTSADGKSVHEIERFRLNDPEPPQITDEELETIPIEINPKVEQWISYFQGRGRPHMERYLSRSTRYSALMKRILRENGLPEDLLYIALIESGFNWKAHSHASAVGYWQFIRGTGKRYGLEINSLVDERRDPVLATQAAADYFKTLYGMFGSWYLAMASYNVGENRVQKEIVRNKTRDFWEISRRKRLPKETINYVPKFIAAKLIGRNPEKYGFTDIEYQQPIEFDTIKIQNPINLRIMAEKMGVDYEDFKYLNPKFRGEIAPPKKDGVLELRVPGGAKEAAMVAASQAVVDRVEFIADAGETKTYRVRRGDTLSTIAKKHRTTIAWLREVNDISGRKKLRIGQRMQVPDRTRRPTPEPRSIVAKNTTPAAMAINVAPAPGTQPVTNTAAAPQQPETQAAPASEAPATNTVVATQPESEQDTEVAANNPEIVTDKGVYYVVQPGDSLYSIAKEYDSTIKELLKMNKMRRGRVLRVGAKILVPKDEKLPADPGDTPSTGKALENSNEAETDGTPESSLQTQPSQPAQNIASAEPSSTGPAVPKPLNPTVTLPGSGGPKRLAAGGSKVTHVVRRGESLFVIARKYGVSMTSIQKQNGIRDASEIGVGRRLEIPQ